MEILKLVVSALTPLSVAIVGFLLLRRIESVKASVAAQSDFRKRWADQFFDCCQRFMQAIERDMALLSALAALQDPHDKVGVQLLSEIATLHPLLSELELRIRRSVVFAPRSGSQVTDSASACFRLLSKLFAEKRGNFDEIIVKMNDFNRAARLAHAEMVGMEISEIEP